MFPRHYKLKEPAVSMLEPLNPLLETGEIRGEAINPKIYKRVEKLKLMRLGEADEETQDRTIRVVDKKSAASMSLLFPGLGQMYMGKKAIGLAFSFSSVMLVTIYMFLSGIWRISVFSQSLVPSYDFQILLITPIAVAVLSAISVHMAFGLFPELKLAQLITANRKSNLHWLALIFPGYGQLLNGQPKKGVIFSSLAVLGLFASASLFVAYSLNWYEYIEEHGVRYVEHAIIVLAVLIVIAGISYIVSVFDAVVVRQFPYLKRPPINRLKRFFGITKNPNDKIRYRKTSLKFVTASLLLVFLASLYLIKAPICNEFYSEKSKEVRIAFHEKGMVILPRILQVLF